MTSADEYFDKHILHYGYFGETKESDLVRLGLFVRGMPDNDYHRSVWRQNGWEPVFYNSKIYVKFA